MINKGRAFELINFLTLCTTTISRCISHFSLENFTIKGLQLLTASLVGCAATNRDPILKTSWLNTFRQMIQIFRINTFNNCLEIELVTPDTESESSGGNQEFSNNASYYMWRIFCVFCIFGLILSFLCFRETNLSLDYFWGWADFVIYCKNTFGWKCLCFISKVIIKIAHIYCILLSNVALINSSFFYHFCKWKTKQVKMLSTWV